MKIVCIGVHSSMTFRKPVCVHTCVCGSVDVCIPVHATASVWRSEHSLGCWSLPPTVFEEGSFVHCCIHWASGVGTMFYSGVLNCMYATRKASRALALPSPAASGPAASSACLLDIPAVMDFES